VLVNPKVEVSTAEVFRQLKQRRGVGLPAPSVAFPDIFAVVRFLQTTTNDLEEPAMQIAPVIGEVIEEIGRLPDVLLARMSGSGATCFGLVESGEIASRCASILRERHPHWWIAATSLASGETAVATPA